MKQFVMSLPARGAWIEVVVEYDDRFRCIQSLPARGAWIEVHFNPNISPRLRPSLPARGAWIEVGDLIDITVNDFVASRKGSVD